VFRRILICLDESEEGEAAVREAARLVSPSPDSLFVQACGALPGRVDEIDRMASAVKPDAIAMFADIRLVEAVLRRSGRPVIAVHPGARPPGPLRRILVPLDGTDTSLHILDLVQSLAAGSDPEIILLWVVAPAVVVEPMTGWMPCYAFREPPDPAPKLARHAAALRARGLRVRALIAHGRPSQLILKQALESGADLIALATDLPHGLDRLLVGNLARQLLHGDGPPVLLQPVRAARRAISAP
jgi:nucleotide-binding universal stress UspA family protein